tara:strand:+ start:282 stop:518 length:237 start_codon:yes stop_codon:yes gene_type:complete
MKKQETPMPETAVNPVIIDLGKKKKKQIKKLRSGEGRLISTINETIEVLQADGTVNKNAQPIIVVVREKSESPWPKVF